jgi:hypothetical protein
LEILDIGRSFVTEVILHLPLVGHCMQRDRCKLLLPLLHHENG